MIELQQDATWQQNKTKQNNDCRYSVPFSVCVLNYHHSGVVGKLEPVGSTQAHIEKQAFTPTSVDNLESSMKQTWECKCLTLLISTSGGGRKRQ